MKLLTKYWFVLVLVGLLTTGLILIGCGDDDDGDDKDIGDPTKMDVKIEVTSSDGTATFWENESEAKFEVLVLNGETQEAAGGVKVVYYDGPNIEGFIVADSGNEYVPAVGLFDSIGGAGGILSASAKSDLIHRNFKRAEVGATDEPTSITFELTPSTTTQAQTELVTDAEMMARIQRLATDYPLISCDDTSYYAQTVDRSGFDTITSSSPGVAFFVYNDDSRILVGKWTGTGAGQVVAEAQDLADPEDHFDVYSNLEPNEIPAFFLEFSNIPSLTVDFPVVVGNTVTLSWSGSDATTYAIGNIEDATICLDGNSTSDLVYSYKITQADGTVVYIDWTQTDQTEVVLNDVPDGEYELHVKVDDEVVNNTVEAPVVYFAVGGAHTYMRWMCNDPDGDPLTYDIRMKAGSAPTGDDLVASGLPTNQYDPGAMEPFTTYYWQVVALDNRGGITDGPVWSFTTGAAGGVGAAYEQTGSYAAVKVNQGLKDRTWRQKIKDFYTNILNTWRRPQVKNIKASADKIGALDATKINNSVELNGQKLEWMRSSQLQEVNNLKYSEVDACGDGYENNPPNPPSDPYPPDGATDVYPNQ